MRAPRPRGLVALALALTATACATSPEDAEPIGSAASPIVIAGLFSTGVNAAGTPLAAGAVDPHYALSSNDPAFPGPNAVVVAPVAGWTGNTATSKWVSLRASAAGGTNLVYTYTTTFTLAGVDPTTATLNGVWACDDTCVLRLNGTQVAADASPAWTAPKPFAVPAGSPFQLGANTLSFVVTNTTGAATGLQVVTLAGNVAGCTLDSQCTPAQFCDTGARACTAKLANGAPVPTLPGHTPPLGGVCTPANGAAVCVSGVCDTHDNACGYAVGDGSCDPGNGDVVCRSKACSVNLTCEPAGGCNVDADCTGGDWCQESTHACTPQYPNGTTLPSDPPHVTPTLDAICTAPAAMLVCQSGVCDTTDDACGYLDGDGPCTVTDGSAVCRSGACSPHAGVCIPGTGCAVDADCTTDQWCYPMSLTCVPKLVNGSPVPTVTGHAPPLTGTCTAAAGAVACISGVCDTSDDACGYADGDGPCTATDAGTVCRSRTCSTDMTCEPANGCNVDADCAAGTWCDETTHTCVAQLVNGSPVPVDGAHLNPTLDGTCTTAAGTLVCKSGVCDTKDNDCGYADGDGPCTGADGATVCRSMACATSGPNQGTCVACTTNAECSGATPVCSAVTNTCVPCAGTACGPPVTCVKDADCSSGDFCTSDGTCSPKLPAGSACAASDQCASNGCASGVCAEIIGSGNGLTCAARDAGGPDGEGPAGVCGLLLAAAVLARRRR